MIRILALGPLAIEPRVDGVPTKALAMMAYVASQPGMAADRSILADLLWPHQEHEQSFHSLRNSLLLARRAHPDTFTRSYNRVVLNADAVWSDLARFEELSRSDDLEDLLEASNLHRGDFLDGVNLRSDPWEDWLAVMRRERREAVMRLLSRLARAASRAGAHPLAINTGRRLVDLDPLCEVSHRLLMHAYAVAGRRAEAVRFFGECAVTLSRELGVPPDEKTCLLLRDIKGGTSVEAVA